MKSAHNSSRISLATAFAALAVLAMGCGDDGTVPIEDSGVRDSTTIVDGGDMDSALPFDTGLDAPVPDAAPLTCSGDCDPRMPEALCGDAGVCALASESPACEEIVGTKAAGASCESTTDCLPGLACFARGDGGICRDVCCPGEATCPDTQNCTGSGMLIDGTETDWWSCVETRSCDVLDALEMCEPGEGCYIVSPEGDTDCLRAGMGEAGTDCIEQNDCAPGYFCAGVTGGTCSRICEVGATSGDNACLPAEGNCQAYPYSPEGSGICTVDTSSTFR